VGSPGFGSEPPEAYGALGGASGAAGTGDGGGNDGSGGSGIVIVRWPRTGGTEE
jgi:hypothetical protein